VGDFNIEILTSALKAGANTVQIKATSDYSGVTTKNVTVNYTPNKTWPLPYTLDWSDYSNIGEVIKAGKAQIVDGEWYLDEEGGQKWLRPVATALGYDRSVAIGDVKWKSFDVLVPLWLQDFPVYDEGNIGIMVRWQGHHEDPANPGQQPLIAWWESGVYGSYKHRNPEDPADCGSRLRMYYGHYSRFEDTDCAIRVRPKEPYYFRFRVRQTSAADDYGFYSMKVWKASDAEPADWVFSVEDEMPDALPSGSILLVAHDADVMFGKVEINPLVDLQITTSGPGSVAVSPSLVSPSDAYFLGQTVELTAVPDDPDNYAFAGWSGDLTGADNPASLTLNKEVVSVTATFAPKRTLTGGVSPAAAGQVELDPPGGAYGTGTVVTLTPKPALNWTFDQWSGPNQGDLVDLGSGSWSILMNSDKGVTANFVPGYALQITTTGQGTVITNPPGAGFPAGTQVTLTAKPALRWTFGGWQGDLTGKQNPVTITMDGNKAIEVVFDESTGHALLPLIRKQAP
jgi:hypothetical protein